jgi:outer membrane cobalamin receptor
MPAVPVRFTCTFAVALLTTLAACHTARPNADDKSAESGGRVITADEIARTHAPDAWELLKQTGAFRTEETSNGEPIHLRSLRGRSSVVLKDADTPALIIDGARVTDIAVLRQIRADEIQLLRILNGRDGTTLYGTNSGAGVIIITTRTGPGPEGDA